MFLIVDAISSVDDLILRRKSIDPEVADYFLAVFIDSDSRKGLSYDASEHCIVLIELLRVGFSVEEDILDPVGFCMESVYRLQIIGNIVREDESALGHPEREQYEEREIDTELFLVSPEQYIVFHMD